MTDTASTANDGAPVAPVEYQNPNDLATEMSAEEEQAFVNETLGLGEKQDVNPEPPASTDEPAKGTEGTQNAEEQKTAEPESKEPAKPEAPAAVEPEPTKPTELEPVRTDDLWVEVEKIVTDEEGNKSVEKVKLVFDPADPGTFIPDDFAFKSDKQLAEILEAKQEMANLYKERSTEFEAKQAEASSEQQRAEQLASWDAEVQDLIESGILEAPKAKVGDKDFLEDPSVQKIDAIFKFMAEANDQRVKDGKFPIRSFGTAFTMYTNDQNVKAEAEAKAKEIADTKAKGALIGGSSAASAGGGERPTYVAGSAANIWQVPVE